MNTKHKYDIISFRHLDPFDATSIEYYYYLIMLSSILATVHAWVITNFILLYYIQETKTIKDNPTKYSTNVRCTVFVDISFNISFTPLGLEPREYRQNTSETINHFTINHFKNAAETKKHTPHFSPHLLDHKNHTPQFSPHV
jgi:hypothetical protein